MGMSELQTYESQAVLEPALVFEGLPSQSNTPSPPYDCPEYYMMFFKVLPCQKKYNHDWTVCPGAHPGERARRRCLLLYRYGAKVCPDMQTRGSCPRGEACYMTHNLFDFYCHPLKYKTKMCKDGPGCKRHFCFFSHAPEEMREGCNIPDEWQLQLLPDGSFSSSSVATVLSCLPLELRTTAQAAIAQLPQVVALYEGGSIQQQQQHPGLMLQQQQGLSTQHAWVHAGLDSSSSQAQYLGPDMRLPPGMGVHAVLQTQQQQQQPVLMNGYMHHQQHQHPQYSQELLQYGTAGSLVSAGPQHPAAGVLRVGPHSTGNSGAAGHVLAGGTMVPVVQVQQAGMPAQGVAMPAQQGIPAAAAGPTILQGGVLQQPALMPLAAAGGSSWVVTGQPGMPMGQAGVPMGLSAAVSGAAATAVPGMLQGNTLLPGQGMVLLPPGQQLPGSIAEQQQQPQQAYMPTAGVLLQQTLEPQQVVSVPLSHTAVLGLQQLQPQQHSPQRPQQLQQAHAVHAVGLPQGVGALAQGVGAMGGSPQHTVAVGEQLVQQLQALGLGGGSPQLQ